MKALVGQWVVVIILLCASFAFVSSAADWFDLRRAIEHLPLWRETTLASARPNSASARPQEQKPRAPLVGHEPAEQKPAEQKPGEQKSVEAKPPELQQTPEPKPAREMPIAIQEVSQPASSPEPRPILETGGDQRPGYDQLKGLGQETAGYGLYSYAILTAPSSRSAAFLSEILRSIPPIGDTAAGGVQLNIFYIPTKKDKVSDLTTLAAASRGGPLKLAARYSEAMYDYKMARAILNHLCYPPPKPMKDLCKGSMMGGPYILTDARPASSLQPVPPPFLFVDLSNINPHAFPEFVSALGAVAKPEGATDDSKLHSLRLRVLNVELTAADWSPKAKRSVVDIVHAFDSLSEGQASR
jgi:hypothetical protein